MISIHIEFAFNLSSLPNTMALAEFPRPKYLVIISQRPKPLGHRAPDIVDLMGSLTLLRCDGILRFQGFLVWNGLVGNRTSMFLTCLKRHQR